MISQDHIFSKSLLAGISIGAGCYLSLMCSNSVIGYVLFSIGFICCTLFDLNLFTDKSGFLSDNRDLRRLILVLLLNLFAAFVAGLISKLLSSSIVDSVNELLVSRANPDYLSCMIKSLIAGFLMTASFESVNKQNHNHIVQIICVVGIVSTGCFHCVVEAFYYGVGTLSYMHPVMILHLLVVVIFNFIGCNLYNLLVNKSLIH